MNIVRWSPFEELDSFERRMRRMLAGMGVFPSVLPAADVYERDGELVFELEVPGFAEQELTVEVADHTLTVKGERVEEKEEEGKTFHVHERLARKFERRFELPPDADMTQLAAEFDNGVLAVHAPKTKEAKPEKVAIEAKA